MIYDCFAFFNELDLLEIRLNTLNAVVDKFVIAEATRAHRGVPKNLVYEQNKERFAAFASKIIYIKVDDLLPEDEVCKDVYNFVWINENRQRNALKRGLCDAKPEDIVLLSDLDEIPNPDVVARLDEYLSNDVKGVRFEMAFYYYYLNFRNYSSPNWYLGTAAARYSIFEDPYLMTLKCGRYMPEQENRGATMQRLRSMPWKTFLPNAGWHFSYLGGMGAIVKKLKSFAHSEYSKIPIHVLESRIKKGYDPFGRGERYFGDPLDETFPRYILENKGRFSTLIYLVDDKYLKATAMARKIAKWKVSVMAKMPKKIRKKYPRWRENFLRLIGRI